MGSLWLCRAHILPLLLNFVPCDASDRQSLFFQPRLELLSQLSLEMACIFLVQSLSSRGPHLLCDVVLKLLLQVRTNLLKHEFELEDGDLLTQLGYALQFFGIRIRALRCNVFLSFIFGFVQFLKFILILIGSH